MVKSIAFDLDGVLYPWVKFAYEYCIEMGWAKTDIYTFFESVFDQTLSETLKKNILDNPLLCYKALIEKDYHELLWKFDRAGWDIYYITLRPEPIYFATHSWLEHSKVPQYNSVYFPEKKSTIIRQFNIPYLVEDRKDVVEDVKNFCDVFLINTYWNRLYEQPKNCTRINSVLDLEGYLL